MSDKSKAYQSMEDAFHAQAAARIAAESELFALGIQHEALKARLKLAEAVCDTAGRYRYANQSLSASMVERAEEHLTAALAAFDAVPGDVVAEKPDCPREPACPTVGFHAADECTPPPAVVEAADLASLTIQRDAAEALARERLDPAHVRAMADAVADRLFVEGERDAAQRVAAEFRGALADIADSEDEKGRPSSRAWMQQRAKEVLVSHGPNRFCLASERDEALAILRDAVKYADEDRMRTPGKTRLARCLDRARKLVGGGE